MLSSQNSPNAKQTGCKLFHWIQKLLDKLVGATIDRAVNRLLDEDACNLRRAIQRRSAEDTADWLLANVPLHKQFEDRYALLRECTAQVGEQAGIVLEFGVYRGQTLRFLSKAMPSRKIFGFDSFEGLDEPWIFRDRGAFGNVYAPKNLPGNVTLIKGFFDQTLPLFLDTTTGPVSFLHIDSDLYSSAKTIFDLAGDRLIKGTVIAFDEYFSFANWQSGEHLAWTEFLAERRIEFEYIGYTWQKNRRKQSGNQLAVRITAVLPH